MDAAMTQGRADDAWAWMYMVARLSLDQATPLLPFMDLRIEDDATFRRIGREWVHQHLSSQWGKGPQIASLIGRMSNSLGSGFATHFEAWARFCYFRGDENPFKSWHLSLTGWCYHDYDWSQLVLPANISQVTRLACVAMGENYEKIGDLAYAQHQRSLSDWDLGIYTALSFDDDEHDPMVDLSWAAFRRDFYCFWRKLDHSLTPTQMDELLDSANKLEAARGGTSWLQAMPTGDWPPC